MNDGMPKILIIDDLPANIQILGDALSSEYRLQIALNGEDALKLAGQHRPDLILLDVMMPGMDGFEVLRRLRTIESLSEIPVIFITALEEAGDESCGLKLGAADYITKPFNMDVVRLRIKNHLELKQQRDQLKEQRDLLVRQNDELKARNREIALLAEITAIFQTCGTIGDACAALNELLPQLFDSFAGALYLPDSGSGLMKPAVAWGEERLAEYPFGMDDCCGIRQGKPQIFPDTAVPASCFHVRCFQGSCHLCVPMASQGTVAGVLHLQDANEIPREMVQLVRAVADSVVLSLVNLKLRETLHLQSISDPLTGLYNRRFMEETLGREILRSTRSKQPLGVMMIDIDHFKRFNDAYGHEAGDTVLREVAALLQCSVRAGDVTCRYGGEEFTVIMPEAPLDVAVERAEFLRGRAEQLVVRHNGKPLEQTTVSVGLAVMPLHSSNAEELLRKADAALYRAKQEGRNRVVVAR